MSGDIPAGVVTTQLNYTKPQPPEDVYINIINKLKSLDTAKDSFLQLKTTIDTIKNNTEAIKNNFGGLKDAFYALQTFSTDRQSKFEELYSLNNQLQTAQIEQTKLFDETKNNAMITETKNKIPMVTTINATVGQQIQEQNVKIVEINEKIKNILNDLDKGNPEYSNLVIDINNYIETITKILSNTPITNLDNDASSIFGIITDIYNAITEFAKIVVPPTIQTGGYHYGDNIPLEKNPILTYAVERNTKYKSTKRKSNSSRTRKTRKSKSKK